ncbi:hypothetical protein H5410_037460, partial [Solanum commersonii]
MIYRDRTGTGMNRDEPVPVYRYQIMIPFRSVYRFNVSRPVPNTTGLERYRNGPGYEQESPTAIFTRDSEARIDKIFALALLLPEEKESQ